MSAPPLLSEVRPVTRETASDLVRFMGQRGWYGNGRLGFCACMRWRLAAGDFHRSTAEGRRRALLDLVGDGVPVGVLAYVGGEPIGWCSVAPRPTYAALIRSRALPGTERAGVWSVVCFFVNGRFRGRGLTGRLLAAATAYAAAAGAAGLEGFPVQPGPRSHTYMGAPSTFRDRGFVDATPAGCAHRVVRWRPLPAGAVPGPGLYSGRAPPPGQEP